MHIAHSKRLSSRAYSILPLKEPQAPRQFERASNDRYFHGNSNGFIVNTIFTYAYYVDIMTCVCTDKCLGFFCRCRSCPGHNRALATGPPESTLTQCCRPTHAELALTKSEGWKIFSNEHLCKKVGGAWCHVGSNKSFKSLRITSLCRFHTQLPWNHIVAQKRGGRGYPNLTKTAGAAYYRWFQHASSERS